MHSYPLKVTLLLDKHTPLYHSRIATPPGAFLPIFSPPKHLSLPPCHFARIPSSPFSGTHLVAVLYRDRMRLRCSIGTRSARGIAVAIGMRTSVRGVGVSCAPYNVFPICVEVHSIMSARRSALVRVAVAPAWHPSALGACAIRDTYMTMPAPRHQRPCAKCALTEGHV